MSRNDAVFLEAKVIHRLIDCLLNLLPIRPPLDELVHILWSELNIVRAKRIEHAHLRTVRTTVTCDIADNLREILRILNNVDVPEHL
jgi:hypothetical protein